MNPDGIWKVNYAVQAPESFSEVADADENGIVVFQNGLVLGRDRYGGEYEGTYAIEGSTLKVIITVSAYQPDAFPVIPDVTFPFILELTGEYISPDFLSVKGGVVGAQVLPLVVNCHRIM